MALIIIGVAGWLIAALAAGVFVVSLGRAAAIGDRDELERVRS